MRELTYYEKKILKTDLMRLGFVNWDRYTASENDAKEIDFRVFGWIDRKDKRKDFVILVYNLDENEHSVFWNTSSKKFTKKIAEIMHTDHIDCKRVEWLFDIPNIVKLDTSIPPQAKASGILEEVL